MLYIETNRPDATFNFAFEEYCIQHLANDRKVLSIWQADNCVMLGRYQITQKEINESYRKELNPQIVRRASGGGTIYTDMQTLLFSVITPVKDEKNTDFSTVCAPFVQALNDMGVKATLGGRNDMMIDGKKISGNAQTIKKGYLCAHGSLLYRADLDVMFRILQSDKSKIQAKSVDSMRSIVTNISEHLPVELSVKEFWQQFKNAVLNRETDNVCEYSLTEADIGEIEKTQQNKYQSWEWNYGNSPFFNIENEMRFPMGKLIVRLNIQHGLIKNCKLHGDFLGVAELTPVETALSACRFDSAAVSERIGVTDLYPYLRGITKEQLIECMFHQ